MCWIHTLRSLESDDLVKMDADGHAALRNILSELEPHLLGGLFKLLSDMTAWDRAARADCIGGFGPQRLESSDKGTKRLRRCVGRGKVRARVFSIPRDCGSRGQCQTRRVEDLRAHGRIWACFKCWLVNYLAVIGNSVAVHTYVS